MHALISTDASNNIHTEIKMGLKYKELIINNNAIILQFRTKDL